MSTGMRAGSKVMLPMSTSAATTPPLASPFDGHVPATGRGVDQELVAAQQAGSIGDPRQAPDAVAAHLGAPAVGVHQGHRAVGAVAAGPDRDEPVGADPRCRSHSADTTTASSSGSVRSSDLHQEVVAGACSFEHEFAHDAAVPSATGSPHAAEISTAVSFVDACPLTQRFAQSRPNQARCRRANRRCAEHLNALLEAARIHAFGDRVFRQIEIGDEFFDAGKEGLENLRNQLSYPGTNGRYGSRVVPLVPAWKQSLQAAGRSLRYASYERLSPHISSCITRSSPTGAGVALEIGLRSPKKNGDLSKPRAMAIPLTDINKITDPLDRQILAILSSGISDYEETIPANRPLRLPALQHLPSWLDRPSFRAFRRCDDRRRAVARAALAARAGGRQEQERIRADRQHPTRQREASPYPQMC